MLPTNSPYRRDPQIGPRVQRASGAARGRPRPDAYTRLALFTAGCLAGVLTVVAMLLVRTVTETESLVELIAHAILLAMPIGMFSFFLELLQESAKPLLLATVMLGFILAGGGIAQIDGGPARPMSGGRRIMRVLWVTLGIWVPAAIFAVVATTFISANPISNGALLGLATILLFVCFVFAVALYALFPLVQRAIDPTRSEKRVDAPPTDLGRRRLVAKFGTVAVGLFGIGYLGRFLNGITGGAVGDGEGRIPDPITSNHDFYLISKNFVDPKVDGDSWTLEIAGLVATPIKLAYIELLEMPAQDQLTTLTCISNEVGGDLISNARWSGVPLAFLLAKAGMQPAAGELAIYAHDGYSESIPLSKALSPTTMLVYLMNGEPLPSRHGYPARLIVPGKYGIKNVKWIRRIELVGGNFEGYWQQRGWTDEATIKTMSRIDVPRSRAIVPLEPLEIGGVAFAGDRGVSAVEYSVDAGLSWQPATVEQIAPLSWVVWRSTWNPPGPGTYSLTVRAIDGTGAVQSEESARPIPDGASGYHSIDVGVTS